MKHAITRENVNDFCRTCLTEMDACIKNEKHNVHQTEELSKLLEDCTTLVISKNDEYPCFLCQQCYEKVIAVQEFRTAALCSNRVLADIFATPKTNASDEKALAPAQTELNKDWLGFDFEKEDIKPIEVKSAGFTTTFLDTEIFFDENDKWKAEDECVLKTEFDEQLQEEQSPLVFTESDELFEELDKDTDEDYEPPDNQNENDCDDNSSSSAAIVLRNKKCISEKDRKVEKVTAVIKKRREIKFKCDECPRRCISQENLDAHKRTHQGLRPYPCTQCERSFGKMSHLQDHIRDVHDNFRKDIICSFEGCGKVFTREASYKMHYRLKHSPYKPTAQKCICEECGRFFRNITLLKEHRFKHSPEESYPYQCEHCAKRYTSKRTYKEHLLRHAGVKKFECPHCGMKKTTRHELRTHINYHTKEKQWPCPLCPSIFNSSANLGMHDRIVHKGIRRFACRFCDQSFGKPDTLKHHEMRHTGERPHGCNICGKRFIQVVALRAHMKTHNKNEKRPLLDTPAAVAGNEEKETATACLDLVKDLL